jgi:hypothetical protein
MSEDPLSSRTTGRRITQGIRKKIEILETAEQPDVYGQSHSQQSLSSAGLPRG